jgi:hypothetical protein
VDAPQIFLSHFEGSSSQDQQKTLGCRLITSKVTLTGCAAKAIFYCPSMNSHRPSSQNTAKERALIPEKDSTRPRSHVSLEKSSKNYKPLEK